MEAASLSPPLSCGAAASGIGSCVVHLNQTQAPCELKRTAGQRGFVRSAMVASLAARPTLPRTTASVA
jgi:hypothetical protein